MPLYNFDRIHSLIPHSFITSESSAIYSSSLLRTFGLALIGIFLPIYLFKVNLPYNFNVDIFVNSIFKILIFFGLESVFTLLFVLIFSRKIYKLVPFQKLLLFSNLVLVISLVGLYNLEKFPLLYFVTPIFLGLVVTCYWVPYHLFFIEKNGDKNGHYGKNLGISSFLGRVGEALGPLIGGFILYFFGFNILFLFASILIVLSSLPILYEIKDVRHHIGSPLKIFSKFILSKRYTNVNLSFLGLTMVFVIFNLLWPILLLFTIKDFSTIGILTFSSLFMSSLAALFVGKIIDRKGNITIHAWGTAIASIFHLFRVFISIPFYIYTLDLLSRTSSVFFELPLVAKTYEIAKGSNVADFVIYREITIHVFRILVVGIVMMLFILLPNWRYIFVLASLGSGLCFLISLQKTR